LGPRPTRAGAIVAATRTTAPPRRKRAVIRSGRGQVGGEWSDSKRELLSRVGIGGIRKDLAPKSRLCSDAIEPFCQVRSCRKIKFRVGGNITVGENGNIRDRVRIACNERSLAEFIVENIERAVSKRPGRCNLRHELAELAGQRPIAKPADR